MAEVELGKRLELLEIAGSRNARRTEKDLGTFLSSSERRARTLQAGASAHRRTGAGVDGDELCPSADEARHSRDRSHPAAQTPQVPARRVECGPREHHRLPPPHAVDIWFDARPAHALSAARTVQGLHRVSAISHRTVFRPGHRTIHRDADGGQRRRVDSFGRRSRGQVRAWSRGAGVERCPDCESHRDQWRVAGRQQPRRPVRARARQSDHPTAQQHVAPR